MTRLSLLSITLCSLVGTSALAHDTWVETNTPLVRSADAVYVELKLGNHGNDRRDFKQASKIDLEDCTLKVVGPDGKIQDLTERLIDTGYTPKEGHWEAKFVGSSPGAYVVSHALDTVVDHGQPTRSIKSGKAFFVVSPSLDNVPVSSSGYDRAMGHPLELIPVTDPVTAMRPGQPITVKVLFKGKPLADARASFVPQGTTLKSGFDERYEKMTDAAGQASFTPQTGNRYLIVVHHDADDETGEDYEKTAYAATLTILVPER